jgi:hypothetical protein
VLFVFYIIIVSLAVMNVVTGIFLQSAIEQASQDHDHMIEQQLKTKELYKERLSRLFAEIDTSKDGLLTLHEFEEHLDQEKMRAFLESLEINTHDVWTFFKLLDVDGGGVVDLEEFVSGCFRLRGNAKSIHVAQIMYENRWIMNKLTEICHGVLDDDVSDAPSWHEASISPFTGGSSRSPHGSTRGSTLGIAPSEDNAGRSGKHRSSCP